MDPVSISTLIAAGISAASAATTSAMDQFQSENDAFTAEIINLSSCSFKVASGTSAPIRGQWMKTPRDITSIYDLIKKNPKADENELKGIIEATGNTGAGLSPFSISTMAKAGGFWGPAGLINYDIFDKNGKPTGDRLIFMMLIRPNWNYTAGVMMAMSNMIRTTPQESIYNYIESSPNSPLINPSPGSKFIFDPGMFLRKYFSTGSKIEFCSPYNITKAIADGKYGNSLKIVFQPGKVTSFTIEDSY